jgi:AraC family cel operon transcriptional repressor
MIPRSVPELFRRGVLKCRWNNMYCRGVETLWLATYTRGAPYFAMRAHMPAGHAPAPHHIADFLNVFAVVSGRGSVEVATDGLSPYRRELSAGDLVLMRARDERVLEGGQPDGMIFYNVAFGAAEWHNFATFAGIDPSWRTAPGPAWAHVDPNDEEAFRPFETVVTRFLEGPTTFDLLQFWIDVIPRFLAISKLGDPFGEPPRWLVDAVAALQDDEGLRHGVIGMLERAHVTSTHLARSVRRFYGMTPSELVQTRRLRRAAVLLATTTSPIGEIGHRCGFGTASYFSSAFLAAEGITPREFRRRSQSPSIR